jgi:hypothetical protein
MASRRGSSSLPRHTPERAEDNDVMVATHHWHGHEKHLHKIRRADGGAHYHAGDGDPVWGSWIPPATAVWEPLEEGGHRHDGNPTVTDHHNGHLPHRHDPHNGTLIAIPPQHWGSTEDGAYREPPDPPASADQTEQLPADAAELEHRGNGLPTDPTERARLAADYRHALTELDASQPPAVPAPIGPPPVPVQGRLGADLGGLEVVKSTYRAMFPGAPADVAEEWALTMGASDIIGRMLGYHRQGRFADPSLVADLTTLVHQITTAGTARTPAAAVPDPASG